MFLNSISSGGPTLDESTHFGTVTAQLSFARDALSGSGRSFRSIEGDWAFYGIGTLFPAYALSYLIDVKWFGEAAHRFDGTFSLLLHVMAFACAIGGVIYTQKLVRLTRGELKTSFFAGIALLVTPVWIGYGFFDYKDVPVATGLVAVTYYAAAYMQVGQPRQSWLFFSALLFLGVQKLAALPLALPACAAVLLGTARHRSVRKIALLAGQAMLFLILLYLLTPPAWREPFSFSFANIQYMSAHTWSGCTLTAGKCIGRNVSPNYSAFTYLVLWYVVQLPILLLVGLCASIYLYLRSFHHARPCQHLIIAALAWPIVAIAGKNSTLYDGIRHTLFLIPLAVAAVFVSIPTTFWLQRRWWLVCYFLFLLVDMITLQPYQYIWFNEPARLFASEKNYETDYWGYSMRQAALHAKALQGPMDWVVSPREIPKLLITDRFLTDRNLVPAGAAYLLVGITRVNNKPPKECEEVYNITRHQLLAPWPLQLAFVAKCPGRVPPRH
jgi:hypothetical protein